MLFTSRADCTLFVAFVTTVRLYHCSECNSRARYITSMHMDVVSAPWSRLIKIVDLLDQAYYTIIVVYVSYARINGFRYFNISVLCLTPHPPQ